MTERRALEQFETRFASRARAYTDPATERRIDALAISRTAMSSARATRWSQRPQGAGLLDRRIAGLGWAVALVAVLIGVVGIAVLGRSGPLQTPAISPTASPGASAGGPVPEVLRHSWERPYAVTPGLDRWGSGSLRVTDGSLDVGPDPAAMSTSAITAAGPDVLAVAATDDTVGCTIGDVGTYHWSVEGNGTVLDLTAISADACPAREAALAGAWVRTQLPFPGGNEATLPAGRYRTSGFDPFGHPAVSDQLSYTLPEGWLVIEDQPLSFVLHRQLDPTQSEPFNGSFIFTFSEPRLAAEFQEETTCGPFSDAPGVGRSRDDLVAAILSRPGVASTPPTTVTIGGYEGRMLDLHVAEGWTGGCIGPGGPKVVIPILNGAGAGTGPTLALIPDSPLRLILLDLPDGRTTSIAIIDVDPSQTSSFEERVAALMPIIESFEFQPPRP